MFIISVNLPVGVLVYLRTQGVPEQAKQILNSSLTLFVNQDAVIHINLHTLLDTALACVGCSFPLLILFISNLVLHFSFLNRIHWILSKKCNKIFNVFIPFSE